MCSSFSYDMVGGDEEKGLREVKGERCWDRRARRDGLVSILFRARIMRGRAKERIREIEKYFDLSFMNTGIGSWIRSDSGTRKSTNLLSRIAELRTIIQWYMSTSSALSELAAEDPLM